MLSLLLVSCCATGAPPVDKYFSRVTAKGAATYFRYAVDAGQDAAAYATLTEASRERLGYTKFRLMLSFEEIPESSGVLVRDFITESKAFLDKKLSSEDRAVVNLYFSGERDTIVFPFIFLRIGEDWLLDLDATLNEWGVVVQ